MMVCREKRESPMQETLACLVVRRGQGSCPSTRYAEGG